MHKKNILLCGGGTGGHYYPLMAIKKELESKPNFNFSFVGSKKGIENSIIKNEKIEYKLLEISGLNRKISIKSFLDNIMVLFNVSLGLFIVALFFKKQKPDLVVSTGGYSSFLPLQMARLFKIPYVLHEQNSYPGLVTKIFSANAKVVFLGFENAKNYLNKSNTIFSGNPVLISDSEPLVLNFKKNLKTLLVFGGSQGSRFLNEKIANLIQSNKLSFLNVVWIVGKDNYKSLKHLKNDNVIIYDYCNQMSSIYKKVDIVVSRSGAMTISELIKFKIPSILVPFKHSSENHQLFNAKFLHNNLCSNLIEEDNFSEETFLVTLKNMIENQRILDSMKSNFNNLTIPNTLNIISTFIIEEKYAL